MAESYQDDNYGVWDNMDSSNPDYEDQVRFYEHVQSVSVKKECRVCGREVILRPDYDMCNTCADEEEKGFGY